VRQREQLARNVAHPVHTLLMTATPIPRTLALVQYGSLVLSSINEMPPGRRPIATHVVVDNAEGREQVGEAAAPAHAGSRGASLGVAVRRAALSHTRAAARRASTGPGQPRPPC
jgi:hypothetical protein